MIESPRPADYIRIVSMPDNEFAYRCTRCDAVMRGLNSRAHAEQAGGMHECPDADWREALGSAVMEKAPADRSWIEMENARRPFTPPGVR